MGREGIVQELRTVSEGSFKILSTEDESMKRFCIAAAIAVLAILPASAQNPRIGTFDRSSIVVAYYRSPQWAEILNAKLADLKQAKAANDTKRVQELERWGSGHQDTAHRQLAGEAPIDNILEALKPAFSEIERKAQVSSVVSSDSHVDSKAVTVDVTELLLDWLKADERTRAIVKDLQSRKVK
jgi:hypothetical protein